MNSLVNINNSKTMGSREIAELTGKQHQHVKRDVEQVLLALSLDVSSFGRIYKDSMNREQTEYLLPHHELTVLLTGYSIPLRSKVLKRWEELELQNPFKIPTNFVEALKLAVTQAEENEKLKLQISTDKHYTDFGKIINDTPASILVGDFAKLLNSDDFKIGRNRLFDWFLERKYLYRDSRRQIRPYQQYVEQGLFEIRESSITTHSGSLISITTKITGKGQVYFADKILDSITYLAPIDSE